MPGAGRPSRLLPPPHPGVLCGAGPGRVGKNPGFFKEPSPVGFLGFLGGFGFFYIFAEKREFLGFFQFQEYF